MATVGETTCLLAAVIVTPAALVLAGRRASRSGDGDGNLGEPAEPPAARGSSVSRPPAAHLPGRSAAVRVGRGILPGP